MDGRLVCVESNIEGWLRVRGAGWLWGDTWFGAYNDGSLSKYRKFRVTYIVYEYRIAVGHCVCVKDDLHVQESILPWPF